MEVLVLYTADIQWQNTPEVSLYHTMLAALRHWKRFKGGHLVQIEGQDHKNTLYPVTYS